jgi:hypothetical protein
MGLDPVLEVIDFKLNKSYHLSRAVATPEHKFIASGTKAPGARLDRRVSAGYSAQMINATPGAVLWQRPGFGSTQ